MKKILLTLVASTVCLTMSAAEDVATATKPAMANEQQQKAIANMLAGSLDMKKVSYCIGTDIGKNFLQMKEMTDMTVDIKEVIEGLKAAFEGKDSKLTEQEMQSAMLAFQMTMQQKQQEMQAKKAVENAAVAPENAAKGEAFLKANKAKEGVKTTKSGLQYKTVKEGTGDAPTAASTVTVNYKGTLIDGTVFDSSIERGVPATFPLTGVIPGWTEGIPLMKVGGKTTFYIPADLAYGANGPGQIGPNQTLIFEVELLGIEK